MAVFTDLSNEDQHIIACAYGIGPPTSVIGIADGETETTYLFRSQAGDFIVTLFESGAEPLDLDRAFRTMEILSKAGIPCPETVRTNEGAATIRLSGKLVAAVKFMDGCPCIEPNPGQCFELGRRTAQIHQALLSPVHSLKHGLPVGAIHGALSRDNVFFVGDSISGIINFRLRHDDTLIAELAYVLVEWTMRTSGSFQDPQAKALLTGYSSVRPLEERERHHLFGYILSAAARSWTTPASEGDLTDRVHRISLSIKYLLAEITCAMGPT